MASQACKLSSASIKSDLDAKKEQLEMIHAFISGRNVFDILPTGLVNAFATCVCFEYLMNFVVSRLPIICPYHSHVLKYCILHKFSHTLSCQTSHIPATHVLYRQLTREGWLFRLTSHKATKK